MNSESQKLRTQKKNIIVGSNLKRGSGSCTNDSKMKKIKTLELGKKNEELPNQSLQLFLHAFASIVRS
jgi:hypothetical protein